MGAKKTMGNIFKSLALPAGMYLFFLVLSLITGQTFFTSELGTLAIIKNTIMTAILAYGAFYNLNSGRFDFSIGAVWLLSGIIGFNVGAQLSLNPWLMLVLTMLIGAGLGILVSLVYLLLRVSAIVVCLGMLLIYEAFTTVLFQGNGITISRYPQLNLFGDLKIMLIVFLVVFVIIYILNNYTAFGYHTRALMTGQRVAVKIGIREKQNVILCWAISGACAGIAVVFKIVSVGIMTPQTNFGTSVTLTEVLLPCFLGAFLGKYSENTIGVLLATLSVQILKVGLNGLQIDPNLQSIFNITFLLIFIMYSSMKSEVEQNRALKERAIKIAEGTA